ncbi:MAG: hypothetical protein LBG97_02305 [Coriobacteriales bacterium]|jgi:hypothetical protein|nr:hypothetical protein [Coriobacteriales bacterium]
MGRKKKDINLLLAMEGRKNATLSLGAILGLACLPIVAGALTTGTLMVNANIGELEARRDNLKEWVENPQTMSAYNEVQSAMQLANEAEHNSADLKQTLYALSSYPVLYGEEFTRIYSLAGASVDLSQIKFDSVRGVLSFNADAADPFTVPTFIRMMRDSGMFADIQYRGYVRTKTELLPVSIVTYGTNLTGTNDTTPNGNAASTNYGTTGTAGTLYNTDADGNALTTTLSAIEVVGYHYSIECLVLSPTPKLPSLPEPEPVSEPESESEPKPESEPVSEPNSNSEVAQTSARTTIDIRQEQILEGDA